VFTGFPAEAFAFYAGLEADNSRTYWHANKATYEQAVKGPMLALVAEFPEHGSFHLFRPNRDVRFSANKEPYKTAQGAVAGDGGKGMYVEVSADGMMAASGYYMMATDQLARFRVAIDAETSGNELAALVDGLRRQRFEVGSRDALKSAPRGYSVDHPRIELLRLKGMIAWRTWPPAKWQQTKAVVGKVRDVWQAADPLNAWLDRHVGPSESPPDRRR
jgi:uncharacterized protein (TIGR02453 family)